MSSVHFIEELEEPVILHISGNKLAMEQSNPATGEFNEIFLSAERVVFEFFEFDSETKNEKLVENLVDSITLDEIGGVKAGTKSKKHKPIIIEAEGYNNAYVAKKFDNKREDSFVVILYSNDKRLAPKVIKF